MGMSVVEYITEEVQRQGHNTSTPEGLWRVAWMMEAWVIAWRAAQRGQKPDSVEQVAAIGRMVEPAINQDGFRSCRVVVGGHEGAPAARVPELIAGLIEQRDVLEPMEFYKQFELIHPFKDGNGRTGKILLNWLNGTLDAPIFPPNNLFGRPIRNP